MKKLFIWLRNKYQEDYHKHHTRNCIMTIAIELFMAMFAGFALIFGNAEETPVAAALNCIILMFWGGFIFHEVDSIIGRKRNDWWHLDITNPQIISLIHALAKAQKDIDDGKIAWKGAFYDPSTHAVEVTRVPLEEYLVDTAPEQNAEAIAPNPTVPEEPRQ